MSNPIDINKLVNVESINKGIDSITNNLEQTLEVVNELIKASGNLKFGDSKDIKKFIELEKTIEKQQKQVNTTIKGATDLQKEKLRIEKELNKTITKKSVAQKGLTKELEKQRSELKQTNTAIRDQIKLDKSSKDSLTAKRLELKKLVGQYNNVDAATRKKLIPSIKKLQNEVNTANEAIGRSQGFVGQYERAFKGLKGVIAGGIGIGAVVAAVKGLVKSSVEFEKSLSSLSAITGAVGEDLDFFAQAAKETSLVTLQSANDIVKAYELVGSIRPELLKNKKALAEVTKQAIILSEATGGKLGLEAAAKATAGTLNQFNLSASQSSRVINTLAAGAKFGSATADLVSESFKNFGTVAADANISLEEAVSLVEVLAEKQILGAEAGTKLRGATLKLQQAGVGYVSGQFDINDALTEANQLLAAQETQAERDKLAIKLFGAENITVGKILLNNTERFEELTEQVTDTTTALEQQEIQNDNLAASWTKLTNTIEASLLTGTGLLNTFVKTLRDAVLELNNLDLIFTRTSKFTGEQIERNFDFLNQLSTKTGINFRELIAQFQGLSEEELIAQKELFSDTAKEAGFNKKQREQLYNEFLRRRLEQIEIERLADEEAQKLATQKQEEELQKRLEAEKAQQKKREANLARIARLDKEVAEFIKGSIDNIDSFEDAFTDAINNINDELVDLSKLGQTNFLELAKDASVFAQLQYEQSQKTLADQIEFIETKRDAELLNTKLTENERKLIIQKSENEITALKKSAEVDRLAIAQNYVRQSQTILNSAAQFVSALQQAELTKAEGNAEEQKKIQKKYAGIQFAITSGQIIADTASGIIRQFKDLPYPLAVGTSSLIGATGLAQLLLANAERQRVQSLGVGGFVDSEGVIVGDRHTAKSGGVPLNQIMAEGDEAASIYTRDVTKRHKGDIYQYWNDLNNNGGLVDMAKYNTVKFVDSNKDNSNMEQLLKMILLKGDDKYVTAGDKIILVKSNGEKIVYPLNSFINN